MNDPGLYLPGGSRGSIPLHKVSDPSKCDPKTALGVDYNHHGWHKNGFTLYSVNCLNSEPPLLKFDKYSPGMTEYKIRIWIETEIISQTKIRISPKIVAVKLN